MSDEKRKYTYDRTRSPADLHQFRYTAWYGGRRLGTMYAPDPEDTRRWRIEGERDGDKPTEYRSRTLAADAMFENQTAGREVKVNVRRGGGLAREAETVQAAEPTISARTALNRLADHLGLDRPGRVRVAGKQDHFEYRLTVRPATRRHEALVWTTTSARGMLVRLSDIARMPKRMKGFGLTAGQVRAICGLTECNLNGLAGWEEGGIRDILALAA